MLYLDQPVSCGAGEKQENISRNAGNAQKPVTDAMLCKRCVSFEGFGDSWELPEVKYFGLQTAALPLYSSYMQRAKFRTDATLLIFWDVAELNFALLTLIFISKLCWNTLVLCILLWQGKNTCSMPLCVTIFSYQPLFFFSPGSLWRAWKCVTAHWLAMWLILGLVKIWCKQILTQCWLLFLPVHAMLGTL